MSGRDSARAKPAPPLRRTAGKAYDSVFQKLKFHVKFTIVELVVMAPTWAY